MDQASITVLSKLLIALCITLTETICCCFDLIYLERPDEEFLVCLNTFCNSRVIVMNEVDILFMGDALLSGQC